jgi:hypothetical protein
VRRLSFTVVALNMTTNLTVDSVATSGHGRPRRRLALFVTLLTLAGAAASSVQQIDNSGTPSPRPAVAASKPATAALHKAAARALAARRAKARITPHNVAPQPNVFSSCSSATISATCASQEIAAINNARSSEGIAPISIDVTRFVQLTPAEQVFAITNLERSALGLPVAAALTAQLNAAAAPGTAKSADPALIGWTLAGGKPVTSWASNWAGGLDALGSDYVWMYDDGVGYNVDCPTAASAGCWGHRHNVLIPGATTASCAKAGGAPELVMGVAVLPTSYKGSTGIGEIFATNCGGLPSDATFTWAQAQHDLLS